MYLSRLVGGSFVILGMGGLALVSTVGPAMPAGAADTVGLPLTATRTARFTATKGTWTSLDVSPDGSRIVFDLMGDLYTIPMAGGQATRLSQGLAFDAQPRWSPDGKRIVFVSDRTGGENLFTMAGDGSYVMAGGGNATEHLGHTNERTTRQHYVDPRIVPQADVLQYLPELDLSE